MPMRQVTRSVLCCRGPFDRVWPALAVYPDYAAQPDAGSVWRDSLVWSGLVMRQPLIIVPTPRARSKQPSARLPCLGSFDYLHATRSIKADMPLWPAPSLISSSCSARCRMVRSLNASRNIGAV